MPLFLVLFSVTVASLGMALREAFRHRRRAHVAWVIAGLGCLGAAIVQAERMGQGRVFEPGIVRIHLVFAGSALAGAAVQVALGIRYWRTGAGRGAHRRGALVLGALAVLAATTGTRMWMSARPATEEAASPAARPIPGKDPILGQDARREGAGMRPG